MVGIEGNESIGHGQKEPVSIHPFFLIFMYENCMPPTLPIPFALRIWAIGTRGVLETKGKGRGVEGNKTRSAQKLIRPHRTTGRHRRTKVKEQG